MPIYQYKCKKCQHETEALQKYSEGPLTQCPLCLDNSLVKQISAGVFILKGDGFYKPSKD